MAKSAKSKTPNSLPFEQQVALRLKELSPSKDAITPSEDVIQHSEDAILSSGDVKDVMEGDNGSIRGDCTKMVVTGEHKSPWRENSYLPTHPRKLATVEQREQFLVILREKKYIVWAADEIGVSRMTVYRRMAEDVDFSAAVGQIIAWREERVLAKIEAVSEAEAVKEGRNGDRMMQLNALAPGKYKRDAKGQQQATQINIVIGFTPPTVPR